MIGFVLSPRPIYATNGRDYRPPPGPGYVTDLLRNTLSNFPSQREGTTAAGPLQRRRRAARGLYPGPEEFTASASFGSVQPRRRDLAANDGRPGRPGRCRVGGGWMARGLRWRGWRAFRRVQPGRRRNRPGRRCHHSIPVSSLLTLQRCEPHSVSIGVASVSLCQ
jgi:hypothetical protein